MKYSIHVILACAFVSFVAGNAYSTCSTTTSGAVEIKVESCSTLSPKKGSNSYSALPRWVHDLDPVAKRKLLNRHTGALIKGQVTESKAVQKGLSNSPGALKGTQISAFIHGSHKLSCSKIKGFVKGKLKETCCDGSGNAPCLWKTGYYLSKVKTSSGSKMKGRGEITSIIADAKKMFKKKEYSKIGYKYGYRGRDFPYEVEFQYYVGMSYFIQEDCEKAKNFFNRIHTAYGRGKANLAFKSMIKKASYNFAVCHAREGDAIGATSILDGMKLDRKFFSKEISRARYDGNFGRIKNTKEWKKFMSN